MHPELFELKALVAGRLDAFRRREIDDHLGTCADCSRHYVALMLGSASPKTAEAEARQGLVPSGAGSAATYGIGGAIPDVGRYGIDAPLTPSDRKPTPARQPHSNTAALETEFVPTPARAQVPVSASLVDAIAKLRAEAEAPPKAVEATAAAAVVSPTADPHRTPVAQSVAIAPLAPMPLIEPSIFMPTPAGTASIIEFANPTSAVQSPAGRELPGFMSRTASASPSQSEGIQQELVVTFSSTPTRITTHRSPGAVAVYPPAAPRNTAPPVSTTSTTVPMAAPAAADLQLYVESAIAENAVSRKPKPMMLGAVLGGAALVVILGFSGYKYFQSSVAQAVSAATAASALQVQAAAARTAAAAPAPSAIAATPTPVQTRIVYVREPSRPVSESRSESRSVSAAVTAAPATIPVAVTIPDVNVLTGSAESAIQSNTQRSATSELTRSARATASRTAAPRP